MNLNGFTAVRDSSKQIASQFVNTEQVEKSLVHAHKSTSKSGTMFNVKEHTDKRTKEKNGDFQEGESVNIHPSYGGGKGKFVEYAGMTNSYCIVKTKQGNKTFNTSDISRKKF